MDKPKHVRTREIQKSLETRLKGPLAHFDSRKYIQHNVNLGDGLAPILDLMDALPADRTRVEPLRSFEDGDYSVAHIDYVLGDWGPMVGFEVHRWEDDRIVEHWDNLQSTPLGPNPSGRTMIDGATDVVDLERTERNKTAIAKLMAALAAGDEDAAAIHLDPALAEHDPTSRDGSAAFLALAGKKRRHEATHMILGQGNFVLAISEGRARAGDSVDDWTAFYDLFRLSGDRVVEHWDVVETIPPRETWKNDNGKF